jgi:iron complex outermembrane recepter protein
MKTGMARIGVGSLCWVAAATAFGGEPAFSEQDYLADMPMVLTASRLRQAQADAPQAVTVIDRDMIVASGARHIVELLRLVPGFYVSYVTYVTGFQPVASYHGMTREFISRIQVLVDGRSVNNPSLGGVDWEELPVALDDIERIEVIRGPGTATYGLEAFLATVNILTRHASQDRGAALSYTAGSNNIRDAIARYGGGANGVDYRVTLGQRGDDGFPNVSSAHRRNFGNARLDWQINNSDSLQITAGGSHGTNVRGFGDETDPPRAVSVAGRFIQARWARAYDADNEVAVKAYVSRQSLDDKFVTDPIPELGNQRFATDDGQSFRRADLEIQHAFSIGPGVRGVWGAGVREDIAQAANLLPGSPAVNLSRVFMHLEWRARPDLLLSAGALTEHNNLSGSDTAPRVAANYRFLPGQTLRASVSRGVRVPSLFEEDALRNVQLGPVTIPLYHAAGSLQPETVLSRELGYFGEFHSVHLTVDIKVFRDDLKRLIGETRIIPDAYFPRSLANGDWATQTGAEGQIVWRPAAGALLVASAAHIDTDSDDALDRYRTTAPRNTLHLLASQRVGDGWQLSAGYHQQSSLEQLGDSSQQPFFRRLDLRAAKSFPLGAAKGEFAVVAENAANKHYTEFRDDTIARRQIWCTLRVEYQ